MPQTQSTTLCPPRMLSLTLFLGCGYGTPHLLTTHTPKCRITESSSTNYLPRNKMKIIQENTLQQLKMSSWQYFETKTIKITKWQYDVKIYGAILYKINGIALALPMPLVGWLVGVGLRILRLTVAFLARHKFRTTQYDNG